LKNLGDIELARLSAQRNQAAFAVLVDRYGGMVRGMARRLTRGSVEADDIAQSAFTTAWRRVETYSGGSFKSWLGTITYREFLGHCRKSQGDIEFDEAQHGSHIDPSVAHYGNRLDLEAALQSLTEKQRVSVIFCVAAGFSHAETAQITGWPLGTVKSHVSRGVAKIRTLLKDDSVTTDNKPQNMAAKAGVKKDRTDVA
jgi:RNA polymerase sigma-70 factor (ECF subfamily)